MSKSVVTDEVERLLRKQRKECSKCFFNLGAGLCSPARIDCPVNQNIKALAANMSGTISNRLEEYRTAAMDYKRKLKKNGISTDIEYGYWKTNSKGEIICSVCLNKALYKDNGAGAEQSMSPFCSVCGMPMKGGEV